MVRAILVLWLCLLTVADARAEQVSVQSGEHDGFTRLVFDFTAPVGWQLTRTDAGYRLALDRPDMRYDLTDVYRPIGRTRLASVWADPENGALMLGIGCACHAFPFELRPDVLVIDLRDGPPPPGSSFEMAQDGQVMAPIAARAEARPRSRPEGEADTATVAVGPDEPVYDWLKLMMRGEAVADAAAQDDAPSAIGDVEVTSNDHEMAEPGQEKTRHGDSPLADDQAGHAAAGDQPDKMPQKTEATPDDTHNALRDEILRQISDGAARGTVELAPRLPATRDSLPSISGHDPLPQIRIGGIGIDPAAKDRPDNVLTAEGERCLPDSAVDLATWGSDAPVAQTMAGRTAAVYGEFDRVDRAAAEAAVKYLLNIGFGAEAMRLIEIFPVEGPETDLWKSMALVVDGDLAPSGPLAGMEVCDGAVALWAVLAQPDLPPGRQVQTGAILRAFSALPPHLRRHLGPTLAGRFLVQGDTGTVRAIRDAILRLGGDPGPAVRLMEAELDAAGGDHDPSALVALQSEPGRTAAAATMASINAIVAEGGTVDAGMLTATEAMLREYKGAEEEPGLRRALALARATQGDFDGAFSALPEGDPGLVTLWAMLAERGTEGAVMTHALRDGVAQVPRVPPATGQRMARRLIDAGFPDAALDWLNAMVPQEGGMGESQLLLAAEAELGRRDASAAMGLLAGLDGPEAAGLRNRALLQLGTTEPLERVRADSSAPDAQRQQAARMARDWAGVAQDGPDVWRQAAGLVTGATPLSDVAPDAPPLARARALLEDSAKARAALRSLMAATPPPTDQPEASGGT